MTDKPKRRSGTVLNLAAVPVAAALLLFLSATPAEAKSQWLARGLAVGGAGYALKEHLGELTDHFGEMIDAAMEGDTERAGDVWGEIEKTPGRLIKNTFPVLKIGDAAVAVREGFKERLKSAERKIGRFVGGVGETVADARAALAIGADERDWYESRIGSPAKTPLPVTVVSGTRAAPEPRPKADPWADDTTDTTKVGKRRNVWEDDDAEADRSAHDWASAKSKTDPWGRDPGAEPDGPPDEAVAGYDGDEPREAEQWQSEYTVALNQFLGLDDGDDDYEAALSTVERLEREAVRRQEEQERQARLEEQERLEAARLQEERERREQLAAEQRARERAEASQREILMAIQTTTAILQGQMSAIQQQRAQRRQLAALKQQQARQRRAEQERYQQQLQRQRQAAEQRQAEEQERQRQETERRHAEEQERQRRETERRHAEEQERQRREAERRAKEARLQACLARISGSRNSCVQPGRRRARSGDWYHYYFQNNCNYPVAVYYGGSQDVRLSSLATIAPRGKAHYVRPKGRLRYSACYYASGVSGPSCEILPHACASVK